MYELMYKNIKTLCKFNHIKMNELEAQIGVSVGYLSKVGNKGKNLTVDKVSKTADILGTTVDDLLKRDFWKELKLPMTRSDFIDAYLALRKLIPKKEVLEILNAFD